MNAKVSSIVDRIRRRSGLIKPATVTRQTSVVEAGDEDVPVGLHGVLSATEKLLAVNKGLVDPDERDSLQFKKFYTPDSLFRERVRLDAGKTRSNMMRHIARMRSLKRLSPYVFDDYTTGGIVGTSLSSPLEEINPMQLLEQSKRTTQMGPGGIGSDDALTPEMQAVQPSQFGFIDVLAGPESSRAGVDVRVASGVKIGSDGLLYQKFLDRKAGIYRWMNPRQTAELRMKFPD